MKKIIILLIAAVFFAIAGCQRENKISDEDVARNATLLKDEVLSQTNVVALTNESPLQKIEPVMITQNQNVVSTNLPEIASIEDKPIEMPEPKKSIVGQKPSSSKISSGATVVKQGSFMKVGSDKSGQTLSPRKYIKISSWVFTQEGKTVDFYLYAVPYQSGKVQSSHVIGRVRGIEVINYQAQYTRYWNGRTIHGNFLPKGKYNIYLTYVIKNVNGKVIKTESRYWGRSTGFYLHLE